MVGVVRPPRRVDRFDLRGRQRTAYLYRAAGCAAAGGASAALSFLVVDGGWFAGFGALLGVIAVYHLRVGYGWVVADATGLRTSRLILGRRIPWRKVAAITTRTYYGKGGAVTVAKLRTVGGRNIFLPAPRTTIDGDRDFDRAVRRLRQLSASH